jgi:hypothetical protein
VVGGHLKTVSGTTRTTSRAHDVHRAFGLGVLPPTAAGISRIVVFAGAPALVARCGLPDVLSAERGRA